MKAILLISEIKEHESNFSVSWKCGPHAGFFTADSLELLSSQLGGLFVRLLGPEDETPEIEDVPDAAPPASPQEPAGELDVAMDAAFSEWEDRTQVTPGPRSSSRES